MITASALVTATPAEAFAIVSDPEKDPLWRKNVTTVELISGEARAVGAAYRAHVEVAGQEIDVDVKIVAVEPGRRVGFSLNRPIVATGGYRVEPDGEGSRVTFELDMSGSGGFAIARERVVGPAIAKGAERDLQALGVLLSANGEV